MLTFLTSIQITRNPIYHFYEAVGRNALGEVGADGDRHYQCLHGNMKVLTVTAKMKYSLNGAYTFMNVSSSSS